MVKLNTISVIFLLKMEKFNKHILNKNKKKKMSILDTLGISEEQYEKAKDSTVTEAFEVAHSGVYDGKVKEVIIYNDFF